MLITVGGAPGQGKSELLASLQEESYNVHLLPKTTRDVNESFCDFQDELLEDRIRLVEDNLVAPEDIIFEGSFLDMFVYSLFTVGLNYEFNEWLDRFYTKCSNAQEALIDFSIIIKNNDDMVISSNASYAFNIIVAQFHEINSCPAYMLLHPDITSDSVTKIRDNIEKWRQQ